MRLLAITGPTAAGKSELATRIAPQIGAEIVSVDSMQVYRGMDVGTDKPSVQVRERILHHLIDVVDPKEEFSVAEFQRLGFRAIEEITSRGRVPLLVGGSGLYYSALAEGFGFSGTDPEVREELESRLDREGLSVLAGELRRIDPTRASKVDLSNPRRVVRALEVVTLGGGAPALNQRTPPPDLRGVTLSPPRMLLENRIRRRAREMLGSGLVDEVRSLGEISKTARQAVGYKEVAAAIERGHPPESALEEIVARSLRLARRQRAWFRRDTRLAWFTSADREEAYAFVSSYFERCLTQEPASEESEGACVRQPAEVQEV